MTLEPLVLVAGTVLLASARTRTALVAYLVLTGVTLLPVFASVAVAPAALAAVLLAAALKLVAAPAGIVWLVRRSAAASALRPSLGLALRVLLALAFALVADGIARFPALAGIAGIRPAFFAVLCGVGMLIVHRNLLAHVLALLAIGSGITLAGAVLAPALPESIKFGAAFNAIVVTFIGIALLRAFAADDPSLDVESLRKLRG